jgi:uncharacterized protein YijF (DUF1287 family)
MTTSAARLGELADRYDKDIDFSDVPELTVSFFKHAKRIRPTSRKSDMARGDSDAFTMPLKDLARE